MGADIKLPPRVVFDTNVVVSALLFAGGRLAPLRRLWPVGACLPLVAKVTVEELLRVLAYPKFKLSVAERECLLADYLPYCEVVRLPARLPRLPACRDVCDMPFLHLAVAGKADFLVTGDADLLELAGQLHCAIVRPEVFMTNLKRS
ncbi:MAG: putative toxin-antitoxin system toxin component, PIN family [Rhodocyclaceae bacterium]|nr:putative toxin-antitoxin system toxin component, PIN family [Rhodocyclaceae bacterium]MDP1958073.1 putative toxin-antitoxin system toxin component, PIN family [Rhodocyclaceae bacterium]